MKLSFITCFILILFVSGFQAEDFNYDQRGADWEGFCKNGTHQSPINFHLDRQQIHTASKDEPGYISISLDYEDTSLQGGFNTHTFMDPIQPSPSPNMGSFDLKPFQSDTINYKALQFHFHAPSEHTIQGIHADLEMHIVHKTSDGSRIAVIALLFKAINDTEYTNDFLNSVISSEITPQNFDLDSLLDDGLLDNFFTYTGSLTTPPCTENVTWIISRQISRVSSKQLKFFTSKWAENPEFANGNGNNRLTQGQNDRMVYYVAEEDEDDFGRALIVWVIGVLVIML